MWSQPARRWLNVPLGIARKVPMHINEMPTTEQLVVASDVGGIAETIATFLSWAKEVNFKDTEGFHGTSRSGRILSPKVREGVDPLQPPMDVNEATMQLMRFAAEEARYDRKPMPRARKGWEFRTADIGGTKVLIAWATWVR